MTQDKETFNIRGLTKQDHMTLNIPSNDWEGGLSTKLKQINQLRLTYADDPLALEQLDIYDIRSKYNRQLTEYQEASEANDVTKINELKAWFKEHYPLITK